MVPPRTLGQNGGGSVTQTQKEDHPACLLHQHHYSSSVINISPALLRALQPVTQW